MPSKYCLSMSGSSVRRAETVETANLYLELGDWSEVRKRVIEDNVYQLNAESSRKRVSGELIKRLRTLSDAELRFLVDSYGDDHFVKSDGSLDETTIVTRTTSVLLERGLERRPGIQEVDGVWLYPSEYFNPKDFLTGEVHVTENTRSIHHFSMSWYTPLEKERYEAMSRMLKRGMGRRRAEVLSKLVATVKMRDATYLTDKLRRIAGRW